MRAKRLVCLIGAAVTLVLGATVAHAALTTETCLAKKRVARGNLQDCLAVQDSKVLLGKPSDHAKCSTKFQGQLAKISATAGEKGIACRYRDNGNGTVTDFDTGLQWAKKNSEDGGEDFANPHDADNEYTWSSSGLPADGTVFTDYLSRLNRCSFAPGFFSEFGFAGQCDWRLPTLSELRTILDCSLSAVCIDPIFGPTRFCGYWTATTDASAAGRAWELGFGSGTQFSGNKLADLCVRAVRSGL